MVVARGGMPGPRTCIWPFLNPTLIVVVFCHCWNNVDASSLLCEPPYTEPYGRWGGRTAEVTPPPTRSIYKQQSRRRRGMPPAATEVTSAQKLVPSIQFLFDLYLDLLRYRLAVLWQRDG